MGSSVILVFVWIIVSREVIFLIISWVLLIIFVYLGVFIVCVDLLMIRFLVSRFC